MMVISEPSPRRENVVPREVSESADVKTLELAEKIDTLINLKAAPTV